MAVKSVWSHVSGVSHMSGVSHVSGVSYVSAFLGGTQKSGGGRGWSTRASARLVLSSSGGTRARTGQHQGRTTRDRHREEKVAPQPGNFERVER